MSAFIVEDLVINGPISFLANSDRARKTILEETGCDISMDLGRSALGKAMFDLNCNAVEQRYGKGEAASFRDLDYAFRRVAPPSAIQAFKSLQCWHYQCSEGNVPETSLLYATIERVMGDLAQEIVCKLPEYDKARW